MTLELLHRGRFQPLNDATARSVGPNAWEVRISLADAAVRRSRRDATAESWDGAVLAVDGAETEPAVVSAVSSSHVTLTVWVL